MEYLMFDKIIKHLDRKKAKPTWNINSPIKATYKIADRLKENGYIMLIADYNYYHIAITYTPDKFNQYHVNIETQAVFGRIRQEIGTRWWEDDWFRQEDVIEYLKSKLIKRR